MSKSHADQAKQQSKKPTVTTKVTVHPEQTNRKESIEVIIEKEGGTNQSKTIVVDISDEDDTNKEIKEEDETEDFDSQKLSTESPSQDVIQHLQEDMKKETESNTGSAKGNEQSDDSGVDEIKPNFKSEEYTPSEGDNCESQQNNEIMMVIEQSEVNHEEQLIKAQNEETQEIVKDSKVSPDEGNDTSNALDSNGNFNLLFYL